MQPEQIMSSDLLDILFADRNKMYGAYTLRKEYNRRLRKALLITGTLVGIALAFYYYGRTPVADTARKVIVDIETIIDPITQKPEAPPPPPPPPQPKQQVATRRNFPPVIVKDPVKYDPPPPIDELINAQVGPDNKSGVPAEGFSPPAMAGNNTVAAVPAAASENDNSISDYLDVESTYPGGPAAWKRFLVKTFRYPAEAEQNGVYGIVLVKFVVDKNGNVSNVQALSGPEELRAEAIRVISRSGKWIAAKKNNTVVNSYKYQKIVFQLSE
jgi:periplasmic protein TonB